MHTQLTSTLTDILLGESTESVYIVGNKAVREILVPHMRKVICIHGYLLFVCLFDLILYLPSTIFQLYREGSSWVEPVLS